MKKPLPCRQRHYAVLFWLTFACTTPSYAQDDTAAASTTLSPYFLVHSDDPAVDRLPLKATDVDVQISGVIANVKVTQHYSNVGTRPLEADYIFPGSTRAAIHALTMHIGARVVTAEIREKQKAREEFAQAKARGQSATLLEQQRPNVFQTRIANIMPGDDLQVVLEYTEFLPPTEATYEFVYPTVVGPRYSNRQGDEPAPDRNWVANPYLHAGHESPSAFNLAVHVQSGIPLQELTSSSHKIDVHYVDQTQADIKLQAGEQHGNNRDFSLRYRLAGKQVQSGILLYEGDKENYFLAMLEPPAKVTPAQIPPRDYVFVVDVSGSMHGFPLDTTKHLLRDLIGKLRPSDTFNVLLFSGGDRVLSPRPLPATAANVARAVAALEDESGAGGTELLPALKHALSLPTNDAVSRSIVVVTDGYVDVETESFDLIRRNLAHANVFAFGIGSSVNRFLIEGLARAGLGEAFIVTDQADAMREAQRLRQYIESPVLTHLQAEFKDFDAYDVEPQQLPDLMATRPVVLFGKWRGHPGGQITLTGQQADAPYRQTLAIAAGPADNRNAALAYLWARQRIATLGDYNKLASDDARIAEITRLGLDYHLLTAYTSFIAVDKVVRNADPAAATTVKQPQPLPAGVSDLAVGEIPATPEPETYMLLGVAALALWWTQRQGRAYA